MAGICSSVTFVKTIQGTLPKGMNEIDFISFGKYRVVLYNKLSEISTHEWKAHIST